MGGWDTDGDRDERKGRNLDNGMGKGRAKSGTRADEESDREKD